MYIWIPNIQGYNRLLHPDKPVSLFLFTGGYSTEDNAYGLSGTGTVTLPDVMTYTGFEGDTGFFTSWESSASGQEVTFTWTGPMRGAAEAKVFVALDPLEDLPETPEEYAITVDYEHFGRSGGSVSGSGTHGFAMQYTRIRVTSDKTGTVFPGDVITYNVEIPPYPLGKILSSTTRLQAPVGTDVIEGSLNYGGDMEISESSTGITLTGSENSSNGVNASYQVKVREAYALQGDLLEILQNRVQHIFTVEYEVPDTDTDIPEIVERQYDTVNPAISNKLDRGEIELTLSADKKSVNVDDEFTVTAKIKNTAGWALSDVKLRESSILLIGDVAAELIQSPAETLTLDLEQEGTLEYKFKAIEEGRFTVSAQAEGLFSWSPFPRLSNSMETEEICVGCGPIDLVIQLPEDDVRINTPFEATVVVTSNEDIPQTIAFVGEFLTTPDTEFLSFTPEPVEPFILTEEDRTRSFPIIIIPQKHGTTTVASRLEATADGITDTYSTEKEVVVSPLKVTVQALPFVTKQPEPGSNEPPTEVPIVNMTLEETEQGSGTFIIRDEEENVISPKVEVIVENVSDQSVTASLEGLDPFARDKSALGNRLKLLGNFPFDFGTIEKSKSKSKEFDLNIMADGRFDFQATVVGKTVGASTQFNTVTRGAPIAVGDKYPAEIEFEFVRTATITNQGPEAFFVEPGGEVKILATVRNRTTGETLHFKGIEAEKKGNAFNSILTSEDGNLVDPPFAHDHEVDANGSVVLSGFIKTDALGAPSGSVRWILPEDAYLIDDDSEKRTDLTPEDFLVSAKIDGWLGDDLSLRIIQDFSRPLPPILTNFEYAGLVAGNFTEAALFSMAKWTYDTFDAIGGIGRVAGTVSADPSLLADALGKGTRAVWETAEMIHLGWTSMSDAEKDAFILSVSDETWRRAQYLATAPFEKEKRDAAIEYTRVFTYPLFDGVAKAYEEDDPAKIAQLYGNITGNIAMEVITGALPTPNFTRYADGAELANLAKATDNIRSFNQQQRILRDVPSGPIGRQLAIDGWGIGGKLLDDVQTALGQLGLKGYARERAPRSITLSEVLDEAVLKPQAMKPKGFNDLDRLMLGNDVPTVKGKDGADLDLEAITVLIWPPPDDLIRTRLQAAGESEETIKAVLARANSRRKDYQKEFKKLKQYEEEGIPIEFDYKSNDAAPSAPNNPPGTTRKFNLEEIETTTGAVIHVPRMGNANNELRLITGDVDWVHFSWLDGTPLDSDTAGQLYELLENCCGLQHGDTAAWIVNGQAIFENKANQIGEYITGQKALLEVTGEAIRAVRIRPNLTRFAANGRDHLIFFDGGTKALQQALKSADLENAFAVLTSKLPPRKVILPFLWFNRTTNFDGNTIDGQEYSYNGDPDAVLARQAEDGSLEYFDGESWQAWDQKQFPNPFNIVAAKGSLSRSSVRDGEPISLTPTSILNDGIDRGTAVLPIVDFPSLWPEQLDGRVLKWFDIGDTLIIAPGTSVQEIRKVVSLEPLTLNRPLDFAHSENTLVAILPDVLVDNVYTSESVVFRGAQWIETQQQVAFEFSLPYNLNAGFEISSNMDSWTPLSLDSAIGGSVSGDTISATYPGEIISIPVSPTETPNGRYFLRWTETTIQEN